MNHGGWGASHLKCINLVLSWHGNNGSWISESDVNCNCCAHVKSNGECYAPFLTFKTDLDDL